MKKNLLTKLTASVLTIACFTPMAACGGGENSSEGGNNKPNANATQLDICVFDGGLGTTWITKVADKFAETYKNTSFETGKKGVFVNIIPKQKEQMGDEILISGLQQGTETGDIYYTSSTNITDYLEGDVMADITNLISEDVYDSTTRDLAASGGSMSILDKMDDFYVDSMNCGTETEPKYYCLPFEDCIYGFVYNHTLFEENNWLHYSGLYGTPKTVSEFKSLLNEIYGAGHTGFAFSPNEAAFYVHQFNSGFIGQYEGYDAANLNITMNGEYTFEGDSAPTTITERKAWMLKDQKGKKELVYFLRDIFDSKYYSSKVDSTAYPFGEVQSDFVMSRADSNTLAMILEGEWWENEAKGSFNTIASRVNPDYGYAGSKSDFRFMPIPQADGGVNAKYTFGGNDGTLLFINKKSKKMDLAEEWMKFAFSEASMETFTMNTGVTLAFDYDLSDEQKNTMTSFARTTYEVKKGTYADQCEIVRQCKHKYASEYTKKTGNTIGGFGTGLGTYTAADFNKNSYQPNLWVAFVKNNKQSLPASRVFASWDKTYAQSDWETAYDNYLASIQ